MNFKKSVNELRDKLFQKVHTSNLVYNTCWEDPAIDRKLLEIDEYSKMVMITSAGCNALDYLLDNPEVIHTIDMNPRQNALMELKKTIFKLGDYQLLKDLFLDGHFDDAESKYKKDIRPALPDFAREFWDAKFVRYFAGKKSFYFRGTSGRFAWLFMQYLNSSKKSRQTSSKLVEAQTLEEQQEAYGKIEKKVLSQFVKWLINRHITLSLLGVPRAQRNLIADKYPGGMAGFVGDKLRYIFTQLPISDNYFWRLYITGKYSESCCPNYLREENFETIRKRIDRIKTYNGTVTDFLKEHPNFYSHYILLDHQDWMAAHLPEALDEEWEKILKNGTAGTKILMRSAAERIDFIPAKYLERLEIEKNKTETLHKQDRVGTYGCVFLGTMN